MRSSSTTVKVDKLKPVAITGVALGLVSLIYLLVTDKNTAPMLNKLINTYNTGRMWSKLGIF